MVSYPTLLLDGISVLYYNIINAMDKLNVIKISSKTDGMGIIMKITANNK